ncbi:MAG: diguanylate cyclase, partial [Campylobacterota bacterium]|nr:diguanylate cyclase [Campylobacterota bacterium]
MERIILIVDNDEVILTMLKEKLLNTIDNIKILEAKTYKEGIRHILNKAIIIDIAILDLNLPDTESGAIVKFATNKNVPTIVLTSFINEDIKTTLISYSILDYIIKDGKRGLEHSVRSISRVLNNYNTNLLLVDDSKVYLNMVKGMLEKMKFNVYTASNGVEALDILENSGEIFKLVLTDFNMPEMDGMELTMKIREKYDKDRLGVIVLSSNDSPDISTQFISIGANDFLNKPYTQAEVAIRINSNLELLELFEKTRDMANKDFMTGAYNRRYFFETGGNIFNKAKIEDSSLVVVMFDIDKFKNINDTYGHDVGDVAIIEVAKILNKNLREQDLMARFGGEEFCVLLENITLEEVEDLFERIRKLFEDNIIKIGDL